MMAKRLISVEGIELPDGAIEVTPQESVVPVYAIPVSAEEILEYEAWEAGAYDREVIQTQHQRQSAYQTEADPLFFKWQAGEGTEADWLAKRAEIAERYPYPEKVE